MHSSVHSITTSFHFMTNQFNFATAPLPCPRHFSEIQGVQPPCDYPRSKGHNSIIGFPAWEQAHCGVIVSRALTVMAGCGLDMVLLRLLSVFCMLPSHLAVQAGTSGMFAFTL